MTADSPSTSRIPWLVWLGWIAAAITGPFVISTYWGDELLDPAFDDYWEAVVGALPIATVGAIIAHRRPKNAVGWLMLVAGVGWFVESLNIASLDIEGVPGHAWRLWLESWVVQVPLATIFPLLPLVFPTGDVPSRRWRPVLWLSIGTIVLGICGFAFAPSVMSDPEMPDRIKLSAFKAIGEVLNPLLFPLILITTVLAVASMVWRFRHAGYVERQQVKWFLFVIAIAGAEIVVSITALSFAWRVALLTGAIGIPAAIMIAILRYNLFDIDRLINRTLVYGLLTITLAVTYFAIVLGLGGLVRSATGGSSPVVVAASTLVVAALFRPLRSRIQTVVDRRYYRDKYDAVRTLETFSAQLRDEVDLEALADDLQRAVRDTMRPAHVSLWLRPAPVSSSKRPR